jgi:predicted phosphodiesterase
MAACQGPPQEVAAVPEPPLLGGSLQVPSCRQPIVTVTGASAPEPGSPVLGQAPLPRQLHLGLTDDPRTSIAIVWRTDEGTLASTVQLGRRGTGERSVVGSTFVFETGSGEARELVRLHEARVCGLAPDTEYVYRVGGVDDDGREAWSPEYRFRTAPDLTADPSAEVTVLVMGDSRNGAGTLAALLDRAETIAAPDLVLFSGDAVAHGQVQLEWDQFWAAAEGHLERVPFIAAHGNHEANALNFFAQMALPGDERDFVLDYGALHLTVINDTPLDDDAFAASVPAFLETWLRPAGQDVPWSVLMHHRPAWSSATTHGSNTELQALLGPIIDAKQVDLVLNGHTHVYERSHPLRAGVVQRSPREGTIYLVAGGAGAPHHGLGSSYWTAVAETTHHFVILTVRAGQLTFTAYREDGGVIDQMTLTGDQP